MKTPLVAMFATILSTASLARAAEPTCTQEPKGKWMDAKKFEADLAKEYKIKKFHATKGGCYEIYGWNKDGKKVEIYFNPVDGKKHKEVVDGKIVPEVK